MKPLRMIENMKEKKVRAEGDMSDANNQTGINKPDNANKDDNLMNSKNIPEQEMKSDHILTLTEVSKIYGELKALDNINLSVEKGEWLAIMGPSGSGKTTMMNIIGCMDRPSMGSVVLEGTNIAKLQPKDLTEIRRDKIGLIFQQFHLVNYLTAVENVMMAQYYHSMPDQEEAMEALESVGLGDRYKHLPNQLSGGEQQRLCIARALINHPSILLADEPTGNLDEKNEFIVMDIFEKLHNTGSTIIVVTHDQEVGDEAERIITLDHGRIAGEVKNKRQRPVIKGKSRG